MGYNVSLVDINLILTILGIIIGLTSIGFTIKYGKQIGSSFKGSSFKKSSITIDKKLKKYPIHFTVGRESLNDSNIRDGETFNVNIWTIKINNKSLKSKILGALRIIYNCKVSIHIENFNSNLDLYFKPKDIDLPATYISNAGLNGESIEELRTEYEKKIGYEYIIQLLQLAKDQIIIEEDKDAELLFLLTLENSNNAFIIIEGKMGWSSGKLVHKQNDQFLILPISSERKINISIYYIYKEKGHDIYRQIEKKYKLKINSWNEIKLE